MIRYLAEIEHYKVYAMHESVYLKLKATSKDQNNFESHDRLIADHYGDPSAAIIFYAENYVVVSGCGLTIYNVATNSETNLMADPKDIHWINGLYQDEMDDALFECRYIDYLDRKHLRVFKINVLTLEITLID